MKAQDPVSFQPREDFPVAPEFLTAMSGQLQGVQQVMEEAGMVEIKSTLRACEVWWSLFGTVWNHCSDEYESLCPYPKKYFQLCCFSWQQVWDEWLYRLKCLNKWCQTFLLVFWGHLLILQVCTMLQPAERWLQVNVKIAYLQEIPTTFATSGGRAPLFFCGKTVRQLDCSIFCLQDQINSKLSQGLPREAGATE